jgi:nucleotide-binding universal stress UspA family protein
MTTEQTPGPVVAGFDGTFEPRSVGSTAAEWAIALGRPLQLLHLQDHHGEGRDLAWLQPDEGPLLELARDPQEGGGVLGSVDAAVVHGHDAARACAQFARRLEAVLLVVALAPEQGAGGLLWGSSTMRVVRDAPCPVLVVPRS